MGRDLIRPCLLHACFSQCLGENRPEKCNCRKRVSKEKAQELIDLGLVEWIITNWVYNDEQKKLVPVHHAWHLVYSSAAPEDAESIVHAGYALKTPRVQTIEKAHIERSVVDGKQEDIDRIEEWGRMSREVIESLIVPFMPDPMEGRCLLIDWRDLRNRDLKS